MKKSNPHPTEITRATNNYKYAVTEVRRFVAKIELIEGAGLNSIVEFANREIGMVWQIDTNSVTVLLFASPSQVEVGVGARLANANLEIHTGENMLGRIVDPLMRLRDGGATITPGKPMPVFGTAPSFYERAIVDEQLETGVLMVDTLFPIVKGQRIAIIGDNKSGKTTFLGQVAAWQGAKDSILIYVLIAKPRRELNRLVARLKAAGVLNRSVIVVADVFDSLPLGFLAPYVGCTVAETFWRAGKNTVVFYDDLSAHAKLYREMSLLLEKPPGREGYPGDMFWQHSTLLERAGKLKDSKASQTVLAVGTTPTGDLTGYLPTSLISMTDGQIVFDLATMHKGIRPAVDAGVSVSRVGGRSQSPQFAELATRTRQKLANFRSAKDFARFGTGISETIANELAFGDALYELFSQSPEESYSLKEQYIMLEALMQSKEPASVSVAWLKSVIHDVAGQDIDESDFVTIAKELIKSNPMVKSNEPTK